VYITGTTNSQDFTAATFASYQKCLNDLPPTTTSLVTCTVQTDPAPSDAFVARISNPATSTSGTNIALTYFSYLGGSGNEAGLAIAVDAANGALLTGWTQSADFPIFPNPNAIQSQLNGAQDAFVARLNTATVTGQNTTASWANYFGGSGIDEGTGIALDSGQTTYLAGDSNSPDLHLSRQYEAYNGGYDAFVTQLTTAASLSITGQLALGSDQTYISAGTQATFTYTLTNNGPDLANNITVIDDLSSQAGAVALSFISATTTSGVCSGGSASTSITCNISSLQSGSTATIIIILIPGATSSGNSATFNGGSVTASAANGINPVHTSVPATMSDFTITAGPSNVSLGEAGQTATYQVQLFPHPVYNTPISLSVTGLPSSGTGFTFTTASVTLINGSPGASTLNITTTARPVTTTAASLSARHFYAIWLSIPALALFGLGTAGDRRRRRIAGILLLCLLGVVLVLQPACSSSQATQAPPSGTPAGTYPLIITATAGSDTKNYPITLTVP
jgi:uncharacterized repeat protein (TIGR01451 family)